MQKLSIRGDKGYAVAEYLGDNAKDVTGGDEFLPCNNSRSSIHIH